MANDLLEVPITMGLGLPEKGNVEDEGNPGQGGGTPNPGEGDLSPEEKLAIANKQIAEQKAKEEAEKKAKEEKAKGGKNGKSGENELTDDQIQSKLDDIGKKEEKDWTKEEKEFVEKYADLEAETNTITTLKNDLQATYNIQVDGDFEDSPDGVKALTSTIAPKIAEQMMLSYLDSVPYMRDFFEHVVRNGKSLDTFLVKNTKPAFESIDIKPLDNLDEKQKEVMTSNLKNIITIDLSSKGVDQPTIESLLQVYEAAGQLYDKAKVSKDTLSKAHKAQIELQLKQEEEAIKAQKVEEQRISSELNKIITTNDFNGIQIPVGDINAFKDAIFRPVDATGKTLLDVKMEKLSLGQRALIDYIIFKDFQVSGLTNKQPSSKAFQFKKDLEANKDRKFRFKGTGGKGEENKTTPAKDGEHPKINIGNFDFESINKQ